ncbi:Hypothetical protein CINCED_3A004206 [Cinara cedri]|uniref:Uncharacterized protein n=1 Tax=Cinara cedri TaxID=506608 RepID=A0A5E4M6S4_9HEMI|nr:Hypothetical protein CINCED_3A004206 [Cinara cedri]
MQITIICSINNNLKPTFKVNWAEELVIKLDSARNFTRELDELKYRLGGRRHYRCEQIIRGQTTDVSEKKKLESKNPGDFLQALSQWLIDYDMAKRIPNVYKVGPQDADNNIEEVIAVKERAYGYALEIQAMHLSKTVRLNSPQYAHRLDSQVEAAYAISRLRQECSRESPVIYREYGHLRCRNVCVLPWFTN